MALHFRAVAEQDERRDGAYRVAGGERLLLVDIDLHEARLAGELGGRLREHRRHRPAGTAPGRPEIDDHRQLRAREQIVELRRSDICRAHAVAASFTPSFLRIISSGQKQVNELCSRLAPTKAVNQRKFSLMNTGLPLTPRASDSRTKVPANI